MLYASIFEMLIVWPFTALELHVCLPDLSHVTLNVDELSRATEIMDTVIEELGLNVTEARRVLSLWLVSADLGKTLTPLRLM